MQIKGGMIKDLKSRLPKYEKESSAATAIMNAWENNIYLDNRSGVLYLGVDRLRDILRMHSKVDAHYLLETHISNKSKLEIEGKIYVSTDAIISVINKRMIGADLRKKSYLKYSEELLISTRELPEIKLKQEEIRQRENALIRQLKSKRIKELGVKLDELTNKKLKVSTAEFSHIRKKVDYPIYAYSIYNGLIVNKEVHKHITAQDIHDEHELLDLCIKMKWNTRWYEEYNKRFQIK